MSQILQIMEIKSMHQKPISWNFNSSLTKLTKYWGSFENKIADLQRWFRRHWLSLTANQRMKNVVLTYRSFSKGIHYRDWIKTCVCNEFMCRRSMICCWNILKLSLATWIEKVFWLLFSFFLLVPLISRNYKIILLSISLFYFFLIIKLGLLNQLIYYSMA